ncbi:hypothetical protein T08_14861 [Trichinella sp. T8]|nr:hypothetical protein T08_14861 [Trichinella sp. T8]
MSFYDKFRVDEEERHMSSYNLHCNMLQLGDSCACFVNSNNEYYSWIKIKEEHFEAYMTLVCAMHYL